MTKDEAVACLERVYDLTNESGKVELRNVIAWVKEKEKEVVVEAPAVSVKPEVDGPQERRAEERDPGEAEQRLAKEMKLPTL